MLKQSFSKKNPGGARNDITIEPTLGGKIAFLRSLK
jgi:hypothetical protein